MDRQIVYVSASPQDTDILNTNKFAMQAVGGILQGAVGVNPGVAGTVYGLACTPSSPATLIVNVASGGIISPNQQTDANAYGSLAVDTTGIYKAGIITTSTPFTCTAPTTSGQSRIYLIQATFQEVDDPASAVVLPYYNAANPSQGFSGPNGSGATQLTIRRQKVILNLKAGTSAATGTQTAPSVDSGYIGLYLVTVAFGQTQITSSSIARYSYALTNTPFIDYTLANLQYLPSTVAAIQNQSVTGSLGYVPLTSNVSVGGPSTYTGTLAITQNLTVGGAITRAGQTVYDTANLTNLNQLTNGPGFFTPTTLTTAVVNGVIGYRPLSSASDTMTGNLTVNGTLNTGNAQILGANLATQNWVNATPIPNAITSAVSQANTHADNQDSYYYGQANTHADNQDSYYYGQAKSYANGVFNTYGGTQGSLGTYTYVLKSFPTSSGPIYMQTGWAYYSGLGSLANSALVVTVYIPQSVNFLMSASGMGYNTGDTFGSYPEGSEISVGLWSWSGNQFSFEVSRVTGSDTSNAEKGAFYFTIWGW